MATEQPIDTTPRRKPVFDYVIQVDPALSTFGWKIVALAHAAMILPVLGAFFPRAEPVEWNWIFVVIGIVAVLVGINLVSFTKMVRSRGYRSPPMGLVLLEVFLVTVAAGILAYAVAGTIGIYRPLIFVPTLLIAMIGNRWVILFTWSLATVTVTISAVASGVVRSEIGAIALSYGAVWGITAIMVHLLASAALHSDDQVGGLAEMAGISARVNNLDDGIAAVLPVIASLAEASRAEAFRIIMDWDTASGPYRFERLGRWPTEPGGHGVAAGGTDESLDDPSIGEIDEARARNGVALRGRRALLLTEGTEGDVVAIVVEGIPQRPFDQLMTRFNLERMTAQVDVLVNRSRYVARLDVLGRTDGLTGLANRRSLFDHLERARGAARRRDEPLAIVMTDLDHFKEYNDSLGHLAGDDLLRTFAHQLFERVRSIDFVARYGGEEFLLVLPATDGAGAQALVDALQARFRRDAMLKGVTFSAGIAVWDGSEDVDTLIDRADTALYRAKADGRDRTVVDLVAFQREGRAAT